MMCSEQGSTQKKSESTQESIITDTFLMNSSCQSNQGMENEKLFLKKILIYLIHGKK